MATEFVTIKISTPRVMSRITITRSSIAGFEWNIGRPSGCCCRSRPREGRAPSHVAHQVPARGGSRATSG